MEKLFKSEKQLADARELLDSIKAPASTDLKEKKILDLAKKNRALQI